MINDNNSTYRTAYEILDSFNKMNGVHQECGTSYCREKHIFSRRSPQDIIAAIAVLYDNVHRIRRAPRYLTLDWIKVNRKQ